MVAALAEAHRSPVRAASEIRFSDVAHYVGLSLVQDPSLARSPLKAKHRARQGAEESGLTRMPAAKAPEAGLPAINGGRSERMRNQLEFLCAEQRAEKEKLKKLEVCLSDSELLEKKAQRRANKQREMLEHHSQRAAAVENQIMKIREDLRADRAPRPGNESSPKGALRVGVEDGSRASSRTGTGSLHGTLRGASLKQENASVAGSAGEASAADIHPAAPAHLSRDIRASFNDADIIGLPAMLATGMSVSSGAEDSLQRAGSGEHRRSADNQGGGGGSSSESRPGKALRRVSRAEGAAAPPAASEGGVTLQEYWDAAEVAAQSQRTAGGQGTAPRAEVKKKAARVPVQQPQPSEAPQGSAATEIDVAQRDEERREKIRVGLVRSAGSAKEAFKKLDLNGSGNISLGEFADGVARQGINWGQITGFRRHRDLFKLFDLDKNGVIDFPELFPEDAMRNNESQRPSTPEFWSKWMKGNRDPENLHRGPKWQPSSPEEELDILFNSIQNRKEVADKRKWMSATIRRLKNRGKSDARCREVVALHLPRGTGPKDREDVQTFSELEVRQCKKTYTDQVLDPVRNIQKVVYDMREQRKALFNSRQKLWTVTMEPVMRQRADEDRKMAASSLGFSSNLLDKVKEDPSEKGSREQKHKPLKVIAQECRMDEDSVEELFKDYLKSADSEEMLSRKGFSRLLQALCPSRTLVDTDIDAWWEQITRPLQGDVLSGTGGDEGTVSRLPSAERRGSAVVDPEAVAAEMQSRAQSSSSYSRRVSCKFEHFAAWWAESEVRRS